MLIALLRLHRNEVTSRPVPGRRLQWGPWEGTQIREGCPVLEAPLCLRLSAWQTLVSTVTSQNVNLPILQRRGKKCTWKAPLCKKNMIEKPHMGIFLWYRDCLLRTECGRRVDSGGDTQVPSSSCQERGFQELLPRGQWRKLRPTHLLPSASVPRELTQIVPGISGWDHHQ